MPQSPIRKLAPLAYKAEDEGVKIYRLNIGQPDLPTPQKALDVLKCVDRTTLEYSPSQGYRSLREALVNYYERYQIKLNSDEIIITSGGSEAVLFAFMSCLNPGDEIIVPEPAYANYMSFAISAGAKIRTVATTIEEGFCLPKVEKFEALINERTKALLINTPSNPTGNCLTMESMKKIAEIAVKHDLIVIADDIYTAFSYQNPFVPIASLPGMKERTITLNSFSKNFTMTGWRIGNIIAPDYIIRIIQQINENVVFTAPSISQRAAIYALRYRDKVQPPMVEEYRKRMFYAADRIAKIPKISVINPPKGSFYLFINIKETGLSSTEAAEMFLMKAHVNTLPGNAFGECGEGYVRIACTVGIEELEEAFDRIEKALQE